ncbi:WD repeat-containing protein 43 [Leptopilina heterotoma]|uniref:WD repeat-containing protein 43 n=1 Tax=Leptopilina heterotoma TaxID=63436 RepID=UPI001CA9D244|nr:WD repeat-containing protein 43 [Leptopilina heterotoma]
MANPGCSAFSNDGQYLANCGIDGKLKIWETATNRLKVDYVPNYHLKSPCSVIKWITVSLQSTNTTSPWKKRKRKSMDEEVNQKEVIAMGSTSGHVTIFDVASSTVSNQLQNGHTTSISAIAWKTSTGLFTAAEDHQIIHWNIQENGIKCKWKSGKGKVTAIAVVPDGNSLLTAERIITWWDLKTKNIIGTFTGHINQVNSLNIVKIDDDTNYLISSATGDSYLSVWSLNEAKKGKTSAATFTMQDEAMSVSVRLMEDSQVMVLAATRSGQAHLYKYQPNGTTPKPIKPSLNIFFTSDTSQKEQNMQQIPILKGQLTEDTKCILAYGSFININFEKVVPDFSEKVMYLERTDYKKQKEKKDEAVSKVKATDTEGEVQYLVPGAIGSAQKRSGRSGAGSQIPLKNRLENLSLNTEASTPGKTPSKGDNMVQLLMQGLQSKEREILNNVLFTKKESVIKNTVAKLPVQAIIPLLKELTVMLQGKTYSSKIAVTWLKALIATHAAQLLSHPDIGEELNPILGIVDAKLTLLTELSRLRGRVSLITGQISSINEKEERDPTEESLLVYQDRDSSDESTDMNEVELESVSDENWEEISDQEQVENCKSDDDASICS